MGTPFAIAQLCEDLASTSKRLRKIDLLAEFLRTLEAEELSPAVLLIVGRVFPEAEKSTLDVGWATISRVLRKGRQATLMDKPLSIMEVNKGFRNIASARGRGSKRRKMQLLESLLGRVDELERKYILRNFSGEMRIGVSEGVMLEGIARAAEVDLKLLQRRLMFSGDLGRIAEVALTKGEEGLRGIGISLYTPLKPMLADIAYSIQELFKLGSFALEYKYDGARIQIHKGKEVKIYSRRLSEVTTSLPEIRELAESIDAREVIVEGEVVAVDNEGRPLPFQELMRRFRRVHGVKALEHALPLKLYLFDVLYDGESLVDEPYENRWKVLARICPPEILASRVVPRDEEEAMGFMKRSLKAGHEGLMAKALSSPYTPARRGKKWLKLKQSETLDVVIIAAEWGHGRRKGWLSNYHLAVRDEDSEAWAMVGKTFKGLTDEEFQWVTRELLKHKLSENRYTVYVEPRLVVEVAFDEVQRSPSYASGYALRFARIKRIREDKSVADADTLERLVELYRKQFLYKGRKTKI